MIAPFTHKPTAMLSQVLQQVSAFHGTLALGTNVTREAAVNKR
jgi:hypothetical protein